jgi:hypothetical protein
LGAASGALGGLGGAATDLISGTIGGIGGAIAGPSSPINAVVDVVGNIGREIENVFNPPSQPQPVGMLMGQELPPQRSICRDDDGYFHCDEPRERPETLFLMKFNRTSREDIEAFRREVAGREGLTEMMARELFILWYNGDTNAVADWQPGQTPAYQIGPTLEPVNGGSAYPRPAPPRTRPQLGSSSR